MTRRTGIKIEFLTDGRAVTLERYGEVPSNFVFDGASVPRFFWRVVFPPGDSRALYAAFVHDYVYRTHPRGWTKANADRIFEHLLICGGIPRWRAKLAYWGVKFFGSRAWKAGGL